MRDPRITAKLFQLLISFSCNTMAFSITPYFSSDAKHHFCLSETSIGFVFATFPAGYMLVSAFMGFFDCAHWSMHRLCAAIRVLVLLFVLWSVLFGVTPTWLYRVPRNDLGGNSSAGGGAAAAAESLVDSGGTAVAAVCTNATGGSVGLHYGLLFGAFRLLQGMTVAVTDVFILLYLSKLFPEKISAVVGEKEAVLGLGVVFGPPLGGALYKTGGFSVPPLATGAFVALVAVVTYLQVVYSESLRTLHGSSASAIRGRASPNTQTSAAQHRWRSINADAATSAGNATASTFRATEEGASESPDSIVHITAATAAESSGLLAGGVSGLDGTVSRDEGETLPEAAAECGGGLAELPATTKLTSENLRQLLFEFPVYVSAGPAAMTVLSIACFAFLEAMVPLYANDVYGVEAWGIGLVMGGTAIVYAGVAITIGRAVGHKEAHRRPLIITFAAMLLAVGMFLVAPSVSVVEPGAFGSAAVPPHGFVYSVVGVLLCGAAMAAIAVAGVALTVDFAKAKNERLVPAAGAVMNVGMSAGGFLGPVVGSAAAEAFGFSWAFFGFACTAVAVGVLYWVSFTAHHMRCLSSSSPTG